MPPGTGVCRCFILSEPLMYTDPQSDFQLVRSQMEGFTSAAQLTLRYVALLYLSKQIKIHELARAYCRES